MALPSIPNKRCSKCDTVKPLSEFHELGIYRARSPIMRRAECGLCHCRAIRERRKANPIIRRRSTPPPHRKEEIKAQTRQARIKLKSEVIRAYGGHCVCCGEAAYEFMTIDHVFNDGAQHRKELKRSGYTFYYWLKSQGYPQDRFQLLCMNCNAAKGWFGGCPHNRRPSAGLVDLADLKPLAQIEREHILRVLAQYGGNQVRTATALGIDRTKLYRRLKSYAATHSVPIAA